MFQAHYEPVKGNYSTEFKSLLKDLLQKDPSLRPSAQLLMTTKLSQVSQKMKMNRCRIAGIDFRLI